MRIRRTRQRGYTLLEFMAVAALIGVLMSLLLPAVQAAREAARRGKCMMQLQNLMIAIHHYEFAQGHLPAGVIDRSGPIRQAPVGYHHNWISAILPYLEEKNLHAAIDFSAGVYDGPNLEARQTSIPLLLCPSVATSRPLGPYSCYAGNHHHVSAPIDVTNTGVFFLNSRLRQDDIFDGTSNTIYLIEKPVDELDFGWMSGTYATLRSADAIMRSDEAPPRRILPGMPGYQLPDNVQLKKGEFPVDYTVVIPGSGVRATNVPTPSNVITTSAGSPHPGGGIFAYGDGRVGFLSRATGDLTMQELCHRQDGRMPGKRNQR